MRFINFSVKIAPILSTCAATLLLARSGLAAQIATPIGMVDDSCVHVTPIGAGIDAQTGDVTLKGALVDHFKPCTVSPFASTVPAAKSNPSWGAPAGSGWYAWTNANVVALPGSAGSPHFTYFDDKFYVPTNPTFSDPAFYYLFPSLTNSSCGASGNLIIQPVLSWGTNPYYGGANWELTSWEVWGCNSTCSACSVGQSPPIGVSPHDLLDGTMSQLTSSEYEVYSHDLTTGGYTYNTIYNIPSSWPKFTAAQAAVFEAYNLVTYTCSELPVSNRFASFPISLTETDVNGNHATNVTSSMTWTSHVMSSPEPACSWSVTANNTVSDLNWDYSHTP